MVLCWPDAASLGEATAGLRTAGSPGARVAAMVGELADTETEAVAVAMARELFGGEPEVVPTVSSALQLLPHLPGPRRKGSGTV